MGVVEGIAAEISRESVDRVWEEEMLAASADSYYLDGERRSVSLTKPPKQAHGSPAWPMRNISVHDYRGTALLGILQGGGWELDGGLVGRVEGTISTLELYAKLVWKLHPGFLGLTNYFRPKEEETYEFFLVRREQGASRATVLKKWVIQPGEILWFVRGREHETNIPEHIKQNETVDVRGFLKYFPETQEAEVTITGLTHPFVERIKVELK
jgi:hypothetical protein